VSGDEIQCVYVLHGTDAYRQAEHRREIVSRAVGDADPQLCVSTFDDTAELADVLDELRTPSLLGPRRVAIVQDADAFVTRYRRQLEEYFQAPSTSATLVLIVSRWDRNWRLAKAVARLGEVLDCGPPTARDLPGWIRAGFARREATAQGDAVDLLAEWVGADLAALDSEIEKLSLYAAGRAVTVDDVAALVAASGTAGDFALTNALTAGDVPGALVALSGAVVRRGDELRVLGMLGWHLRRALQGAEELAARKPLTVRMPPSARAGFESMIRRRGWGGLQRDMRRLLKADLALKSGGDPTATMQELVIALCI